MNERLAAADAALKAGRRDEAIEALSAALTEDPNQTWQVYRALLYQLYSAGRFADAAPWGEAAVKRHPRALEVLNLHGVILRKLGRHEEALAVLDQAAKANPNHPAPLVNKGNIYLDMGEAARAEAVFAQLARRDPRNAEHQRMLGRAMLKQGRRDQAMVRFRQATNLKKDYVDAWLDLAGAYNEVGRDEESIAVLDKALGLVGDNQRLLEAKAVVMRRAGHLRKAEAYLQELAERLPEAGWVEHQIGSVVAEYDRVRGNTHLRRALELEPGKLDYIAALIESLNRTREGDEGANIEEAYQLALKAVEMGPFSPAHTKVLAEVFVRAADFDTAAKVGDFKTLGRGWAETNRHTALLAQMGRTKGLEDKLELVEQHRIWGRAVEAVAAAAPIRRPPPRPADGRIRLGFMSSDLRGHPVAYFAMPLFEHIDRERFDVYCYSFYQGEEDGAQKYITSQVKAFRWHPDISARDAAQMMADDQLDMLIELGGSTHMNKLEVMAYRPAPLSASWLGYPHSAGLSTIDYFICDPYSKPTRPEFLIETPLLMPKTWIALGKQVFTDRHVIDPGLPEDRKGHITFGTANNPHKYNRPMLELWAEVLKRVPDSRFAFIRPEGGTPSFVKNMRAEFERCGVAGERIEFHTIRGDHMRFYNELDISLDTTPLTGGTTTTESLWMGVPVISLIGEAFFERLSYSIMSNSGVGDLASPDKAGFVDLAAALAADKTRRLELRQGLREAMRTGPLGRTDDFARDFYAMIARAVQEQPAAAKAGKG
jgi:predicted O-linked N-acetylglucosamine transferase (SPINDLY family)